jgi:hypothetical protein
MPFLNEEQEAVIIGGCLDAVAAAFAAFLPAEVLDQLRGASPVELSKFKVGCDVQCKYCPCHEMCEYGRWRGGNVRGLLPPIAKRF